MRISLQLHKPDSPQWKKSPPIVGYPARGKASEIVAMRLNKKFTQQAAGI